MCSRSCVERHTVKTFNNGLEKSHCMRTDVRHWHLQQSAKGPFIKYVRMDRRREGAGHSVWF